MQAYRLLGATICYSCCMSQQYLTVEQAAQHLSLSEETIRRWLRSGKLKGARIGVERAGWRIPRSELARISQRTMWKFYGRKYHDPDGRIGELFAYWEVESDPISDNFTVEEMNAEQLFAMWVDTVSPKHPDGLVPISWTVEGPDIAVGEMMPFQFEHYEDSLDQDFLTFFTWPINTLTGEQLNWYQLPVVDKLWRPGAAKSGGFIQEFTGWKPSILQPFVYLPALLHATP